MRLTISFPRLRLILLFVLAMPAAMLLPGDRQVIGAGASTFRQPLLQPSVALQGRAAVDFLKEQGLYNRLRDSVEAGRSEFAWAPQKGAVDQAHDPMQRLQAEFSSEQMLLEPVRRRGRPHWRTGLRLRGNGSAARLNAVETILPPANGVAAAPSLLTEAKKLTASDSTGQDQYGYSVAVSVDTVAVGARRNDALRGAVYIYERNQGGADNWGLVKKLTASDAAPSDVLGVSVAIQGDTVVAGAFLKNENRGAVYIFERNQGGANNWGEVKKLIANGGAPLDLFGGAVALNGETLVIGAIGGNNGTGAAYLHQRNQGGADNWGLVKKLTASDAGNNESFGVAVGISGEMVVIGAESDTGGTGAAYLFARNQGGANNWGQFKKLTASDATPGSAFGNAVSLSHDTLAIGAEARNGSTGAVYLFERNQGGADNWGEIKILTAGDGAEGAGLGDSVGISHDTVVAGASGDGSMDKEAGPGAAYVFERNQGGAGNWGEVRKLTASDGEAADEFGAAIGISGDAVVVGAPGDNAITGAAYLFTNQCGQWAEIKKSTASDAAPFDRYGQAIAINGDTAVAGAFLKDNSTGAAYILKRNQGGADNWGELKKLTASDAAENAQYGISAAISGDTIVVGANGKNQSRGAVYIYERNQGGADNWGEVKILTASDPAIQDQFGHAVGIDNDTIVVGARGKNSFTGAVYIYGRNQGGAGNWGEVKKFTASDAATNSEVGFSVGISGDTIVAGAYRHNDNAGAAYIFRRNQGGADNWGEVKKLTASDAASNDFFGQSAGIDIDTVVVGAFGKNSFSGAVYIFERNQGGPDNWGEVKKLASGTGGANERFGQSAGISGDTVVAGAPGFIPVMRPSGGGPSNGPGAVYVFQRNQEGANNWGEAQRLTASDGVAPDGLGVAAAIHNGTIAGGADGKNNGAGAAYIFTPSCAKRAVKGDFDGDGKTDLAVWRGNLFPAPWRIINSNDGSMQSIDWGTAQSPVNDEIVPGDYDGDGKTDVAVFRRSSGHWYIQRSSDGGTTDEFWGLGTDEPVPGDYDGDGKTDVAVFRASANSWYIKQSSDGMIKSETWGTVGDTPVPGDYDGDGKTDVAVWRGAVGGWYIKQSSDGMTKSETWGTSNAPFNDVPVPADYDGDGKCDVAVWRGTDTNWYIIKSSDGQTQSVSWGTSAAPYFDVPVPGDYDGDGKADVAVWRPLDGNWLVIRSSNGTNLIQAHGQSGDTPVPSKGVR